MMELLRREVGYLWYFFSVQFHQIVPSVEYVQDNGRMSGTTATAADGFHDVTDGTWYVDAIGWAAQNGIASGYSDGRFGPNDPVTREQLAAILWRSAGRPAVEDGQNFADQGKKSLQIRLCPERIHETRRPCIWLA